ncbi:MAG: hypothetical protein DRG24_03270 [Epsilonproteobacteria bacterium]|nr:MAG: hypothetical protein DRG24_03270 [Campylobacterota bacterium]
MIYETQGKKIDLTKITRLYPAVTVKAAGEMAQVSLEWAEMKKDVVSITAFVLVFDIDPLNEVPNNRIELVYETKDELIAAMNEVAIYFQK